MQKISVVINTLNEEKNIERAINSVAWTNEIIVCDMHSEDKTVEIAKKLGTKIFFHKREDYVEPARNFAVSKASNDWILVLDPDEEVPTSLAKRLQEIADGMEQIDYVRLPRKNIIFGHFMQASMWWPDYNIRFFKKDKIKWGKQIHRPPETIGLGLDLPADEKYAITHKNYESISDFIKRMDRYTSVQAAEIGKEGYQFKWQDFIRKPLGEFLSRFFAGKGYKDGLHGLALSLLQAFSFLVVYLKVWEKLKFKEQEIDLAEFKNEAQINGREIEYWFKNENRSFLKKIYKIFK
ncbi:MAG: glycosyltransferase family 2 protein [Candidatus Daviesbacteria bacterium]|nr:glycosyltransferase family 2 protein [Candidatus Daviesbacteria bacterium]